MVQNIVLKSIGLNKTVSKGDLLHALVLFSAIAFNAWLEISVVLSSVINWVDLSCVYKTINSVDRALWCVVCILLGDYLKVCPISCIDKWFSVKRSCACLDWCACSLAKNKQLLLNHQHERVSFRVSDNLCFHWASINHKAIKYAFTYRPSFLHNCGWCPLAGSLATTDATPLKEYPIVFFLQYKCVLTGPWTEWCVA